MAYVRLLAEEKLEHAGEIATKVVCVAQGANQTNPGCMLSALHTPSAHEHCRVKGVALPDPCSENFFYCLTV